MRICKTVVLLVLLLLGGALFAGGLPPLAIGVASHAFDHLGNICDQAPAAAASGATIIYSTGLGEFGYEGLPDSRQLLAAQAQTRAYLQKAKASGIRLAIGYVCATSIVKLREFDSNWTPEFRARFRSRPTDWLQRDRNGKPLASWYGGDYSPACMNNPDWRTYEKQIVRMQLEAGHDGIFFDNPTVHPDGCYCDACMKKFASFLRRSDPKADLPPEGDVKAMRELATNRSKDFMRFRTTIATDFLADMRAYARTINPNALITCNNSLNSPDVFYSQFRTYAYDIEQLSRVEDLVVVEDMATQPRVLPDGKAVTYGPVYALLHAISHGKPVVACVLADADYHTPPNLVRLAMAEAAAHGASYLSWPTWPENVRRRMSQSVRPEAELLRQNAALLSNTTKRSDAIVYLPFDRWEQIAECRPLEIARTLDAANIQFDVASEEDLSSKLASNPLSVLVVESEAVIGRTEAKSIEHFKASGGKVVAADAKDWLARLQDVQPLSAELNHGPPTVRMTVWDQPGRCIVHLLNLNVQRLSSFEDQVTPASGVHITVHVPFGAVRSVKAISADANGANGPIPFSATPERGGQRVQVTLPMLEISTILVIE